VGSWPAVPADGYIKEFTRHSNDVLMNLNELRHRDILTDTTLVIGSMHLRAHSAVLVACSGFFYSLYSHNMLLQGHENREQFMTVSLPNTLDPSSVSLLLDFMYTSCLPLTPSIVSGVLSAASYLQMDHVADTCRWAFLTCQRSKQLKGDPESPLTGSPTLSPNSPDRSSCQPNSPAESNTCKKNMVDMKSTPDPKACNWKKYKYIVLNPLCAATTSVKVEEAEDAPSQAKRTDTTPKVPTELWSGEVPGQTDRYGKNQIAMQKRCLYFEMFLKDVLSLSDRGRPPATRVLAKPLPLDHLPLWHDNHYMSYCYSGRHHGNKSPYRCNVCGAQFNRPANLKTHSRIHSGEKPYRCDTCGARFVQVAHLRAHVLIHTGEKPYPCNTCGTRFRHLQTLKSHLRIHTGEKPYTCEKCDLHFRHKSQLRLHLRQKHGAITNTKIRYKVLTEPYQPLLQAC
uniref:BCL6B transcription repressor n=1 Tax=Gouania willdenowi TaxID=441366 RepID=A0A8C5ETF2_GOUWI